MTFFCKGRLRTNSLKTLSQAIAFTPKLINSNVNNVYFEYMLKRTSKTQYNSFNALRELFREKMPFSNLKL